MCTSQHYLTGAPDVIQIVNGDVEFLVWIRREGHLGTNQISSPFDSQNHRSNHLPSTHCSAFNRTSIEAI